MRPLARMAYASHALIVPAVALPGARFASLAAWGAVQAVVGSELLRPGSRRIAPNLLRVEGETERIALTFDDGPAPGETERLLDALDAAGIGATFFLVGRRARACPALVRRIAAAGHTIGNHTQTHPMLWAMAGPRRAAAEVGEAQAVLADITGRAPAWFRPPMGHKNLHLAEALEAHGLKQATWSVRSYDTVTRDPGRVTRRILSRARGGGIVLLHEGLRRPRDGSSVALAVLGPLLDGLGGLGLRPVSLETLLPARPPAAEAAPARAPRDPDSSRRDGWPRAS